MPRHLLNQRAADLAMVADQYRAMAEHTRDPERKEEWLALVASVQVEIDEIHARLEELRAESQEAVARIDRHLDWVRSTRIIL